MTGNRINHQTDDQAVNTIRKKFGTFCHGTGNDGGSSCTEDGLENEKSPERNAVRCHGCSIIGFRGDTADLTEEAVAGSEHDTETDEPEDRGSDTEIHEVFHDDVAGIFCTGEAGLYHGKTGLHEEDQSGTTRTQIVFTAENSIIFSSFLLTGLSEEKIKNALFPPGKNAPLRFWSVQRQNRSYDKQKALRKSSRTPLLYGFVLYTKKGSCQEEIFLCRKDVVNFPGLY